MKNEMPLNIESLNFDSTTNLIPAIIQDSKTDKILMHAYMNLESLQITLKTKKVTFFSRSRNSLWTKGETSGNFLNLVSISTDCDQDTLLIQANPEGPTCHLGSESCFKIESSGDINFLKELDFIIDDRFNPKNRNTESNKKSYIQSLIDSGLDKIIQKVGEEAVETVIAAKNQDSKEFIYESADLVFHLMVLLKAKGLSLKDIAKELKSRHE